MSEVTVVRRAGVVRGRLRCAMIASAREVVGYEVVFADGAGTLMEALEATAGGVSIPGFYDVRGGLVLVEKRGRQQAAGGRIWSVICYYRLPWPGEEPRPVDAGPGDKWAVVVAWAPLAVHREVFADVGGLPLRTLDGSAVDGVAVESCDDQLCFSFTTDAVDFASFDACRDHVNAGALTVVVGGASRVFPGGSLLCWRMRWWPVIGVDGLVHYRVRLSLLRREHLPQLWRRRLPQRGWVEVVGGVRKPLVDKVLIDGVLMGWEAPARAPFLKDAGGGEVRELADGETVEFMDRDLFPAADFGALLEGLV